MRRLLILLLLPLLATSISLPRLDPCQIDNTECEASDFDRSADDSTTCHTTSDVGLGWNVKKCDSFVSYCADIVDIGYEQEHNRIRCDTDEAPAADPTAHVPADVADACKRWKRMEYCQWNWLNMGVTFVFVSVVGIGSFAFCTKKSITEQEEEEKQNLLVAVEKAERAAEGDRVKSNRFTIKF